MLQVTFKYSPGTRVKIIKESHPQTGEVVTVIRCLYDGVHIIYDCMHDEPNSFGYTVTSLLYDEHIEKA